MDFKIDLNDYLNDINFALLARRIPSSKNSYVQIKDLFSFKYTAEIYARQMAVRFYSKSFENYITKLYNTSLEGPDGEFFEDFKDYIEFILTSILKDSFEI